MNPPIPLQLRILRGNPGKRPLRNEPQPKIGDGARAAVLRDRLRGR
jgi:hypothetical protein